MTNETTYQQTGKERKKLVVRNKLIPNMRKVACMAGIPYYLAKKRGTKSTVDDYN